MIEPSRGHTSELVGGARRRIPDAGRLPGGGGSRIALVGIEDLQNRLATDRPEAVLGHAHHGPLTDNVPTPSDPITPLELQADARQLGQGPVERARQVRRLEHEESAAHPTGMGREPAQERLVDRGEARRQVEHEQVDRPTCQQGARQGEPFTRTGRAQNEQPAQVDAATDSLERVEGAGEIEEGHDGTASLCLGHRAERERRLAARGVTANRRACLTWQSTRPKERVELRETSRDDSVRPLFGQRRGGCQHRRQGGC